MKKKRFHFNGFTYSHKGGYKRFRNMVRRERRSGGWIGDWKRKDLKKNDKETIMRGDGQIGRIFGVSLLP